MDKKLKEILDKLINKETLKEKFNSIPDEVLKVFMERSIKDASNLNKDLTEEELRKLSYSIFRAYCIGYIVKF